MKPDDTGATITSMGTIHQSKENYTSLRRLPRDLIASRELLFDLVQKDLRVRYRYAALGFVWAVLEPLAYMVILSFIFERILVSRGPNAMFGPDTPFASGLLCGLVFWQFTTQSLSAATTSLLENQNIVRKVAFTREVIPLAAMGYPFISLLIGFGVFLSVHLVLGGQLGPSLGWVLPLFALQWAITMGLGLFTSASNVRFRDVSYIVSVVLVLGFYATPIFYDLDWVLAAAEAGRVPPLMVYAYLANPMVELIEGYRQALLEGQTPELWLFFWPTCVAALSLLGGAIVFRRCAPTLADYV